MFYAGERRNYRQLRDGGPNEVNFSFGFSLLLMVTPIYRQVRTWVRNRISQAYPA